MTTMGLKYLKGLCIFVYMFKDTFLLFTSKSYPLFIPIFVN